MRLHLFFLFILASTITFSQQVTEEDKSIEGQFDKIYRISTSYRPPNTGKSYKVIDQAKYQQLKVNVLDSIKSLRNTISEKETIINKEKEVLKNTNAQLSKTKSDLDVANQKENSISLFGLQLNKTSYNLLLWSIITILLLGLSYFIFKFFRSNVLTKEAQENLLDVEQEFEQHRKKSLEREQKLRRQLQDEINKQRNS